MATRRGFDLEIAISVVSGMVELFLVLSVCAARYRLNETIDPPLPHEELKLYFKTS